jgi:uncharacterized protein (TIGR00369 family)
MHDRKPMIDQDLILRELRPQLPLAEKLDMQISALGWGRCTARLPDHADLLRPGGTISGPAMMALADYALWIAVMAAIGQVELAVTTNLNINFLRKPKPGVLVGDCRLLKVGKRLAYGEVSIYTEGEDPDAPVAHVTSTYSIPPRG